MSDLRPSKSSTRGERVVQLALGTLMIAFIALFAQSRLAGRSHSSAIGIVKESRIVVDHTSEGQFGATIYYRMELRVSYAAAGEPQDRWLTASEVTPDRDGLALKLASSPKTCQVYWDSRHPENARCRLE
jgi:hypothetical protein